jgi:hypothetical protein
MESGVRAGLGSVLLTTTPTEQNINYALLWSRHVHARNLRRLCRDAPARRAAPPRGRPESDLRRPAIPRRGDVISNDPDRPRLAAAPSCVKKELSEDLSPPRPSSGGCTRQGAGVGLGEKKSKGARPPREARLPRGLSGGTRPPPSESRGVRRHSLTSCTDAADAGFSAGAGSERPSIPENGPVRGREPVQRTGPQR